MRRLNLIPFVIGFSVLTVFAGMTQAQDTGWVIDQFVSDISVQEDSSVTVQETITADFGSLEKHGIFRTIPVDYRDRFGNKLNIRLKVVSVTDETGEPWQYQVKRRGGDVEIKIGDPDLTLSGAQTYSIRYLVRRVITRFPDHDELYWNVTGNDWPVVIRNVVAYVRLPDRAKDATCFAGQYGSNLRNCTVSELNDSLEFRADTTLYPGSGLTVVAAAEKGVIRMPSSSSRIWWFVTDNWPYAIPLTVLAVLVWLYWQHGRDERYKSLFEPSQGVEHLPLFTTELVPSTYAPLSDIKPAVAGTLIDEEINIRDIAATIVDLAVKGYLRIEEIGKTGLFGKTDYNLIWTNQDISGLDEYESSLLLALFGKADAHQTIKLSDLKYKFHTHLKKIRDSLFTEMKKDGYFYQRPDKIVTIYRVAGAMLAGFGVFLFSISLALAVGLLGSGGLTLLFAKAMPKRTAHGRKHYLRVLGLRNFINLGAYREQIWERADIFEEVMPYAIALNLTHKWAELFQKVSIPPPKWYSGSTPFSPASFSYSMENFTRMTTSTLPAVQSSAATGGSGFGGGGSSGGGFGGGGGGSW